MFRPEPSSRRARVETAVAEHERTEAEAVGRAVLEAAAQGGTASAELLARLSPHAAGTGRDH